MENKNSKLLVSFVIGAAVGAAIGYFLASDRKGEIITDIKNSASKIKDELKDVFEKGKQMVDNLSDDKDDILGT